MSKEEKPEIAVAPEGEEVNKLIRDLMTEATTLVIKVATCDCNHKDSCGVYEKAKSIAKIIDQLQDLRKRGVGVGKARRKA